MTPWAKGEAQRAAVWAFKHWLDTRGGTGSHEENQAIEQVRLMMSSMESAIRVRRRFSISRSRPARLVQGAGQSTRVVGASRELEG